MAGTLMGLGHIVFALKVSLQQGVFQPYLPHAPQVGGYISAHTWIVCHRSLPPRGPRRVAPIA